MPPKSQKQVTDNSSGPPEVAAAMNSNPVNLDAEGLPSDANNRQVLQFVYAELSNMERKPGSRLDRLAEYVGNHLSKKSQPRLSPSQERAKTELSERQKKELDAIENPVLRAQKEESFKQLNDRDVEIERKKAERKAEAQRRLAERNAEAPVQAPAKAPAKAPAASPDAPQPGDLPGEPVSTPPAGDAATSAQ